MAEGPPRQGWRVPQRMPALVALAGLALIAVLLLIAGHVYRAKLAPLRHRPIETFPAPGVETYVHAGRGDPDRPAPHPAADPALAAAKRAVVADGLAGWPR